MASMGVWGLNKIMYTRSGLTWVGADMARSRKMSSCSSAVMKRADGVGTVTPDVRGCCCSCAAGGTNAVASDTRDTTPMATMESMVASDNGEVFIMQGKSGHKVRGRWLKNDINCRAC